MRVTSRPKSTPPRRPLAMVTSAQPVLLEFGVERGAAHAEQTRSETAVSLRLAQRALERFSFGSAHLGAERTHDRCGLLRGPGLSRQAWLTSCPRGGLGDEADLASELRAHVRFGDQVAFGEHDQALEEVLKLPHVAWP